MGHVPGGCRIKEEEGKNRKMEMVGRGEERRGETERKCMQYMMQVA